MYAADALLLGTRHTLAAQTFMPAPVHSDDDARYCDDDDRY